MSGISVHPASLTYQTHTHGDATVLRLVGDLAGPAAQQVRTALLDLLAGKPKGLHIDMSHVQTLDDLGLGGLCIATLWARKFNIPLAIIPSQAVRDRLTAAKLDQYLTLVEPGSA